MTIFENEGRWDASNVRFEAGEIHRYDKKLRIPEMRHIDYGIAVLSAQVFKPYPDDLAFDLADVYARLVADKQMAAYEVKQRFYEIGSPEGLAELDSLLGRELGIPAIHPGLDIKAHLTACTTEENSMRMPSPVVFTIRPRWRETAGLISSCRSLRRRLSVPSSSIPVSRQ